MDSAENVPPRCGFPKSGTFFWEKPYFTLSQKFATSLLALRYVLSIYRLRFGKTISLKRDSGVRTHSAYYFFNFTRKSFYITR